jgi:hypothetical protein
MRRLLPLLYVCLVTVVTASLGLRPVLASDKSEEAREATVPTKKIRSLDFSKFDEAVVKDLRNAWVLAKNGKDMTESVMLLFKMIGGSYKGRVLPPTNEHKQSTFDLPPNAFAIFHTHPATCDPRPSLEDIEIADKHQILMFTITAAGMYVYDPHTKKTSQVMRGTDWLEVEKWNGNLAERMASLSPAFKTDSSQISSR